MITSLSMVLTAQLFFITWHTLAWQVVVHSVLFIGFEPFSTYSHPFSLLLVVHSLCLRHKIN